MMKEKMTNTMKANCLVNCMLVNHRVFDAVIKTRIEQTQRAINRIVRYHQSPTMADVELGIDEIKRIARRELVRSVKRINFICAEVKRFDETILVKPVKDENGRYKKPEEMTNRELLQIFDEYRNIDWLIKAAKDEFSSSEIC